MAYLRGSRAILAERLANRRGHFFPRQLLDAQLRDIEEPGPDEQPIIVLIGQSANHTVDEIQAGLGERQHRQGDPAH